MITRNKSHAHAISLLATLLLFGGYVLSLIYRLGDTAFGYDTGIYRRYIVDYFARTPNTVGSPFGFHYFSDLLLSIGLPLDAIAYSVYLAIGLATIVLMYVYVREIRDAATGAIAAVLTATSLTWLDFFGWYYYRNLIAIAATLTVLILYRRRSPFIVLPLIIIGVIHPFSLIPIGGTLVVRLIFARDERKYLFTTGSISLLCIAMIQYREFFRYLPILEQSSGSAAAIAATSPELSGQFIELKTYLLYSFPYILFGLLGLARYAKKYSELTILGAITLVLMLGHVILYRRLFMTLDMTLIIFAALYLRDWTERFPHPRTKLVLIACYSAALLLQASVFVERAVPLVTESEIVAMLSLQLPPHSFVLAMSPTSAPWLYGFTPYRVIAPGMLDENLWNYDTWVEFWSTPDAIKRSALLSTYTSSSVYIFIGTNDTAISQTILKDPHLTPQSEFVWKYTVQN